MRRLSTVPNTFANANSPLSITTYDGSGQITHPDIYDFGQGNNWNGYRFWLVATPYPGQDSTKENPSIWASNNGTAWIVPTGLTNPIVAYLGGTTYNSDPTMTYNPTTDKLYVYYRVTASVDSFRRIESSDGIAWTNDQLVYTFVAGSFNLSPQVNYNKDTGIYTIWYFNISSGNIFQNAYKMTSPDGLTFSTPYIIDFTSPVGHKPWHFNVKSYGGILYGVMAAFVTGTAATTNKLFYIQSIDGGESFKSFNMPLLTASSSGWDKSFIYQSCLRLVDNQWCLWYSAVSGNTWRIGLSISALNARNTSTGRTSVNNRAAAQTVGNIGDSFNRPDSANVLGTTTLGNKTWAILNGTFGITNKSAYMSVSTNDSIACINAGSSDVDASMSVLSYGGGTAHEVGIYFRVVDTNNYWRFLRSTSNLILQRRVSGVTTTLLTISGLTFTAGDILRIVCMGNNIGTYFNSRQIGSVVDSSLATAILFGIGGGAGSIDKLIDNFVCRPIISRVINV